MNWQAQASASHYLTALAVQRELESGNVGEAAAGIQELVEALSRSERRALKSYLVQLMTHVIKWQAQPERRSRGWAATIANARAEIRDIQEETPSLSDAVVRSLWDESFARATRQAEGEMNAPSPVKSLTWDDVFAAEYRV
jgi:hypothetical protein